MAVFLLLCTSALGVKESAGRSEKRAHVEDAFQRALVDRMQIYYDQRALQRKLQFLIDKDAKKEDIAPELFTSFIDDTLALAAQAKGALLASPLQGNILQQLDFSAQQILDAIHFAKARNANKETIQKLRTALVELATGLAAQEPKPADVKPAEGAKAAAEGVKAAEAKDVVAERTADAKQPLAAGGSAAAGSASGSGSGSGSDAKPAPKVVEKAKRKKRADTEPISSSGSLKTVKGSLSVESGPQGDSVKGSGDINHWTKGKKATKSKVGKKKAGKAAKSAKVEKTDGKADAKSAEPKVDVKPDAKPVEPKVEKTDMKAGLPAAPQPK